MRGSKCTARAAAERHRFTPETWLESGCSIPFSYAVTRVDDRRLWAPATDAKSGTIVLLGGRLAFDDAEWARAECLPFEGGLAARLVLEHWLRDPACVTDSLNGAFGVVILEKNGRTAQIITDRLGIFPLYVAERGDESFIGSHTDILANALRDAGHSCSLDDTTLAEVLGAGSATQPFTYYKEIRQLEPGSRYQIDASGRMTGPEYYWRPAYDDLRSNAESETIVHDLSHALRKAIERRSLPRLGNTVVMLSGGADSRCALFGAHDASSVTALTLCDEPNSEVDTAQQLAKAAAAAHRVIRRSPEYYIENADESMRVAGGMWNLVDAHYTGARQAIQEERPGTVLTGCYADYLFKGLALNRRHRRLFGKTIPLYDLADFSFEYYHRHAPVASPWSERIRERLCGRFTADLRNTYDRNCLRVEGLRIRPFSREADCAGRLYLLRVHPWDPFVADNDVLRVYEKMTADQKLNGVVFGRAVENLCGPAATRIFNNNYGTPVGASEAARVAWFAWGAVKRRILRATRAGRRRNGIADAGSWPNWPNLIRLSPRIADFWQSTSPSERELYANFLGCDPWRKTREEWAGMDPLLLFRIMSSLIWLRQRQFD